MTENTNSDKYSGYFMPHHAVIKESSQTIKVRVVFDASAKTSTGISLNDCLKAGPTIRQDLFSIILRFRTHQYVLTADIEKMYRQILVNENDTSYQKILYRENVDQPIKTYNAVTVTYGTKSAPYLAIRSLFQLAEDSTTNYSRTAEIIKRDFYVDDILTGADTINDAIKLRDELIKITNSGGLTLRKWASNAPEIITSLLSDLTCLDLLAKSDTHRALGVEWNALNDVISYKIISNEDTKLTKRKLLSNIAQLFDPIGLLGPIIVATKILMQKVWQCDMSWDESLPTEIYTRWKNIQAEFRFLNDIKFDRKVIIENAKIIDIHGFCDASEKAYGACIYLRSVSNQNQILTKLLCSKNRVAPMKSISLPKLELCAALLLARLLKCILESLCKVINNIYLWSDSTITLQWIQTQPHLLKTFVANRVAEIRNLTRVASWKRVPSKENPADCLSRGQLPSEFLINNMWQIGPLWLSKNENHWPNIHFEAVPLIELKPTVALKTVTKEHYFNSLLQKYSSLTKLKRVVAYCLRFIKNISNVKNKVTGYLHAKELNEATVLILKSTQYETFQSELTNLTNNKPVERSSDLKALNPFVDENGLIRVGGRLENSNLNYFQKHPIVLPKNHHVTKLIIKYTHIKYLHSGVQSTLHAVRERYWPIAGKNVTKHVLKQCIKCFRAKPKECNYIMGNLPRNRVIQTRPFLNTGVDYCGPFYVKEKKYRNKGKVKCYAAVFVCFVTKACHIELVTDLTTDSFLASLRRFFARRGKCLNLYSDNATNFVGAKNELKDLHSFINSNSNNKYIGELLANEKITWHFSPPRSPHFGGLWEAAVKSFKHHFYRTVGDALFTYEELYTYVTEIEAILNSRPLTPLSSDPNDLNALSPSHFHIGDSLTSLPDQDLTNHKTNRLSVWQHIQFIKQHFWKRWSKEYLNELNTRNKWQFQKTENMKIGTLIVLKENNSPPMHWPLGRIMNVHPGKDGIVRSVTIKTKSGTYDRSIKSVAPLPLYE